MVVKLFQEFQAFIAKLSKISRKKIKYKTVTDIEGKEYIGLLEKTDTEHIIKNLEGKSSIKNEDVQGVKDTFNGYFK